MSSSPSSSNFLSGEGDPEIQKNRERRLRSMCTPLTQSSSRDSGYCNDDYGGKHDLTSIGIDGDERIRTQRQRKSKFCIEVIDDNSGGKHDNDDSMHRAQHHPTNNNTNTNDSGDNTNTDDNDDDNECPPPISNVKPENNKHANGEKIDCEKSRDEPIARSVESVRDNGGQSSSASTSSSAVPSSLSLMERMMAESSLARKKQADERETVVRKRAAKTSFGMKKGFLNGSSSNNNKNKTQGNRRRDSNSEIKTKQCTTSVNKRKDDNLGKEKIKHEEQPVFELDDEGNMIPLPKSKTNRVREFETLPPKLSSNTTHNDPLRLQEVQDALKKHATNAPGLVDRIAQNPKLAERMLDPKMTAALEALKDDPKRAMARFRNDPEVMEFLRECCGAIGEHFTELGTEQERVKEVEGRRRGMGPMAEEAVRKEEKRKMGGGEAWDNGLSRDERERLDGIMADESLTAMLMDSDMQRVMQECSTQGRMQMYMQHPDYGPKLRKMIKVGLLKVA